MTTGRINQVSLQETCFAGSLKKARVFLHLFEGMRPEDLAQPVRQAYDYWQELPLQETCFFAKA